MSKSTAIFWPMKSKQVFSSSQILANRIKPKYAFFKEEKFLFFSFFPLIFAWKKKAKRKKRKKLWRFLLRKKREETHCIVKKLCWIFFNYSHIFLNNEKWKIENGIFQQKILGKFFFHIQCVFLRNFPQKKESVEFFFKGGKQFLFWQNWNFLKIFYE